MTLQGRYAKWMTVGGSVAMGQGLARQDMGLFSIPVESGVIVQLGTGLTTWQPQHTFLPDLIFSRGSFLAPTLEL